MTLIDCQRRLLQNMFKIYNFKEAKLNSINDLNIKWLKNVNNLSLASYECHF